MTDNNGNYEISVEEGVEPPEDAIDAEQLVTSEGLNEATAAILRQLGATEEEIEELIDGAESAGEEHHDRPM